MVGERRANQREHGGEQHYERRGSPYEVIVSDSPALDRQFFQLRYKVFCEEHPEFSLDHNIERIETDEFDRRSVKILLIFRPLQMVIGGARVIMPDHRLPHYGLPCIQHPDSYFNADLPFDIKHFAEISRFMLSRSRIKIAKKYLGEIMSDAEIMRYPNPVLYLLKAFYSLAKMNDIHDYGAMVEPALIRMIQSIGVDLDIYSDILEYHGKRQVIVINSSELSDRVTISNEKNIHFIVSDDEYFSSGLLRSQSLQDRYFSFMPK
jgi:N-acyl amino acid synthase of PEP-CTERM/exosortase system